ncbi:MAG: hypothetical protein KGI60_01530 [Patescibacteria group bacterium]|nr:hypothetical protein [Patescibacteria group bacterium]
MHRPLHWFSKRQFFTLWALVLGFLALTTIGAFAQTPNLQINPSSQQPPLCQWTTVAAKRYGAGDVADNVKLGAAWTGVSYCYDRSGHTITSVAGYPVYRYGGVPSTGTSPDYCIMQEDALTPVALGSRGTQLCPPLDSMVSLSADSNTIAENGTFTIHWSAPTASSCALTGNEPETGSLSENFDGTNAYIDGSKTYDFVKRGVYNFKFSCKGYTDNSKSLAQGTVDRTITIYVGNIPPAPTVSLSVSPDTIQPGDSATLTWTSQNAVAISINQGVGIVAKSGSLKVKPSQTTRYTISASGEFAQLGLSQSSATVHVVAPQSQTTTAPSTPEAPPTQTQQPTQAPPAPEVGLRVNGQKGPLTMSAPASFTVSWTANNYCLVYGAWLGIKTKAGQQAMSVTKPGTYTYTMYCPTVGTESVTVNVTGAGGGSGTPLPVAEAGVSLDGTHFSRSIRVTRGQQVHVWLGAAYDVNGDGKASRDSQGGWSLMSTNGKCDWNYDLNQGTPTFDVAIPNPATAKDCTVDLGQLTFFDQPGVYTYGVLQLIQADGGVSNIANISVAVDPPPPPTSAPVIDLRANGQPDQILLGAPAQYTLTWNVTNADSCTASDAWDGAKFTSGSQQFVASSKRTLNYALTCAGKLGTTTKNMLVTVAELPVCDFSALPTTLQKSSVFAQESVLSWNCQYANSCAISPSTGAAVGTYGTARVSPSQTTTYTLTCQNLDGNSSFDQAIQVQ